MPSSSWRIVVDPRAAQDLKKLRRLHHPLLTRVIQTIDSLSNEPYAGKPLKGEKHGTHSLRVGDFRIMYDLYPAQQTIHIIRAGDRKEIYR